MFNSLSDWAEALYHRNRMNPDTTTTERENATRGLTPAPFTASFLGMPAVIASEAMQNTMRVLQRVATTAASVLVTGESGSGKELAARAIHEFSPRRKQPWIDINCAALPDHLLESELFGYEKGAFSGADVTKPGMFE